MMKTKVLFLIHDLGQGGAEKVLCNLVNRIDKSRFDLSVTALFGGGVNEASLAPDVHYRTVFPRSIPGNSHAMKLLSPRALHRLCVKGHYCLEVAYLEGPSTRVISGCPDPETKLVAWVHGTMTSPRAVASSFRSEKEARACYDRLAATVFVSRGVKDAFERSFPTSGRKLVLYNTCDSEKILSGAREPPPDGVFREGCFHWCGIGKLAANKGFDRMLRIQCRLLQEGYPVRFLAIGAGPLEGELRAYCRGERMEDSVVFLGYRENPYSVLSRCDLYVCASHAEGFSTAATEALIVGTPVCTVDVSGMQELLGESGAGIITENDEDALYCGIRSFLDDRTALERCREAALARGRQFRTEQTVRAAEDFFDSLTRE